MEIVYAILGSGALSALIAGIFNLIVNRKGRLEEIENSLKTIDRRMKTAEKDSLRTQLLLLLSDYPEEANEIMTLAQHYFVDLKGDWYMTSMFNRWLVVHDIAKPEWFNSKE